MKLRVGRTNSLNLLGATYGDCEFMIQYLRLPTIFDRRFPTYDKSIQALIVNQEKTGRVDTMPWASFEESLLLFAKWQM